MQLNQSTEYAINGLAYLAKNSDNRCVFVSEIAQSQGASESYMGKIFQSLTKAGIVRSSRGLKGGFTLVKNPKEISLLDVIEAVEGPLAFSQCAIIGKGCPRFKTCKLRPILSEVQKKVELFLAQKTVKNILDSK